MPTKNTRICSFLCARWVLITRSPPQYQVPRGEILGCHLQGPGPRDIDRTKWLVMLALSTIREQHEQEGAARIALPCDSSRCVSGTPKKNNHYHPPTQSRTQWPQWLLCNRHLWSGKRVLYPPFQDRSPVLGTNHSNSKQFVTKTGLQS